MESLHVQPLKDHHVGLYHSTPRLRNLHLSSYTYPTSLHIRSPPIPPHTHLSTYTSPHPYPPYLILPQYTLTHTITTPTSPLPTLNPTISPSNPVSHQSLPYQPHHLPHDPIHSTSPHNLVPHTQPTPNFITKITR